MPAEVEMVVARFVSYSSNANRKVHCLFLTSVEQSPIC